MSERKWDIDLEANRLVSDDGFFYKLSTFEKSEPPKLICNGHPMLAPEELYLVGEVAKEAYQAYKDYKKNLH